jgi:hypothetical protein
MAESIRSMQNNSSKTSIAQITLDKKFINTWIGV